jgi:hypothetical protein
MVHNNGKYIVYIRQKTKNPPKAKPIQIKLLKRVYSRRTNLKANE